MNNNELRHWGIKGMKWGVRRYQNADGSLTPNGKKRYSSVSNKQLREERDQLSKKYYKAENKEAQAQLKKLHDEAIELATKYDFDQDDGGGGTTAASRKAGQRYMEIWDEIENIQNEIDYKVRKKTGETLAEKYGKERVNSFEKQENIATGMKLMGAVLAVPVGLGLLIGLTS